MTRPEYFALADVPGLLRQYPLGTDFLRTYKAMSSDQLRSVQEAQFTRLMARGWTVPFYQRLWGARGIEPGDIRSLDDIARLPTYDKADLMASIAAHPPFGDFHGLPGGVGTSPAILHTTSGTTGKPQVLLFGPRGREVGNLLVGRMALWQGLADGDVVHSVYGHGMINGGHYIREAYAHFTNAVFMSAGTGIETRSAAQVRLMADFGASVAVGFIDYIRKLAEVARDEGLIPGEHIKLRMIIGHLGTEDRRGVEDAWGGARAFDWYGVGDTGCIAGEGPERDGLYVWEDAQYLELCDVDSGAPVPAGQKGDMVVTCLYKDDVAPCIRFNTHDVSAFRTDSNVHGIPFRRIEGFLGRSDNMVKLKGINVFPHAIGALIENRPELTGEYVCHMPSDGMPVTLEHRDPASDTAPLVVLLRAGLGVEVAVAPMPPGGTAAATQIDVRQKPIRLIDERKP
ncbi:phenylacetate-coenzyme A ligase [Polymorphobacter multimanifer]|uniref:phenylacetate--CoA ligase family protein n=1 Tax=Polymorphobacter multimanifer TaxID=1070431 RepID=UPI001662C55C|nr:phenylacetate--CoA ligase family protein [Polymorphobacter multimanifer]GGI83361.1 phenylacetate-coenzyme A ligase [Polymorphobacter multimanifer]